MTLEEETDLASAIIARLALADTKADWDYPGILRVHLSATEMLATGLHGYHYGQVDVLRHNMWDECGCADPSHHYVDDIVAEGERDPQVIATALAAIVKERQSRG